MKELIGFLKNKAVHICFMPGMYAGGGEVASDYTVLDIIDGFMQMRDKRKRTVFCRLDQVGKITVLSNESKE